MKKILVLNASQSKRGATRKVIDGVVDYISQKGNTKVVSFADITDAKWNFDDFGNVDNGIIYFDLKKLVYKGCIDCGYCKKHRGCMLRDDIKFMYKYFDDADYIILASPIYFGGTPSKLKALIDRFQAVYHSKYTIGDSLIDKNKKRLGINILLGGEEYREDLFFAMKNELSYFYRSVNTQIFDNIEVGNTDNYEPFDDEKFMAKVYDKVDKFLEKE